VRIPAGTAERIREICLSWKAGRYNGDGASGASTEASEGRALLALPHGLLDTGGGTHNLRNTGGGRGLLEVDLSTGGGGSRLQNTGGGRGLSEVDLSTGGGTHRLRSTGGGRGLLEVDLSTGGGGSRLLNTGGGRGLSEAELSSEQAKAVSELFSPVMSTAHTIGEGNF